MFTRQTHNPNICAQANDPPIGSPTGMRFLEPDNITQTHICRINAHDAISFLKTGSSDTFIIKQNPKVGKSRFITFGLWTN